MTREAAIAMEHAISPGLGKHTGRRLCPTHDEIAQLAYSLYESLAGKKATNSKIGWSPNRNSCGTTPNGDVPSKHTTR